MRILIWYRNDLRLHDHEPLNQALQKQAQVIPLYCFDPRQFSTTSFGFPKTGAFRAEFLLGSVAALRRSLQALGSDLVIRQGEPERLIPELVKEFDIDAVYWHEEATAEEVAVESALEAALDQLGVESEIFWGSTLVHIDDLPFEPEQLPDLFTTFRKKVEKSWTIYPTFATPEAVPSLPKALKPGKLPTLKDFGLEAPQLEPRAVLKFEGGEIAGLERLQHYFWQANQLKDYKQTRNGMLGADYSSKFSPWLASGCLSPRRIYEAVKQYESERVKNDSTYWLIFELLWRDYFRFVCVKYGDRVFSAAGIRGLDLEWKQDPERFRCWQHGETGFPLVDANMREINTTGFMSNRGRQT